MKTISKFFTMALVFGLFLGMYQNLSAQVLAQDSLALVALYDSTNGANWTNKTNWLTGPVSTWSGIRVVDGRVDQVGLRRNNLVGTIPPEIGNLTNMTQLNLSENQISGPIPVEIGNLIHLKVLSLYVNQLSGSIPTEIGNLTNLMTLQLNQNQLSETIPTELFNLTNLNLLSLHLNNLSGPIPPQIGNLTKLENLNFFHNQLLGSPPPEIQNLAQLAYLRLSSNLFTGAIPNWIGNLINLTSLYMDNNSFSDAIPPEIGNLTKLTDLNLSFNDLSDPIPDEIGYLTNLEVLYLNGNQLSGSIPSALGSLTKLNTLCLDRNNLIGPLPLNLFNLVNLANLRLFANQLSDSIPSEIGNLINLTQLWLHSNQFAGKIPVALGNLTKLQYLYLHGNQFTGAIPIEFANLVHLKNLYINNNRLIDLPNLSPDTSLLDLQIYNNKFTFEDIEPNLFAPTFFYSPQDSIGQKQDTTVDQGASLIISVTVGGTANQYQWMKDKVEISGAVNSSYVIDSVEFVDQGSYVCKITNTLATKLTLYSRPINVIVSGGVGVENQLNTIPEVLALCQNYPNPFNTKTTIRYNLPKAAHVRLVIYDLLGRPIKTLVDAHKQPGHFQATWHGADEHNLPVASGVYLCRMEAANYMKVIKLAFVK